MGSSTELQILEDVYRAAVEEFDAATTIVAAQRLHRTRPTPAQSRREEQARRVLEDARRAYLAAWRAFEAAAEAQAADGRNAPEKSAAL